MQGAAPTTSGTAAPEQGPGFPPFKVETFPGQIFWLAITFAVLFVVLWRVAAPRIQGTIAARKGKIAGDLEAAEAHRKNAEKASADYEAALTGARNRAQSLAEENRKRIQQEVDAAKAGAETEAQASQAKAEARIDAMRNEAKAHVRDAARGAAIDIVARLTGDKVSDDEAAKAVSGA